MYSTFWSSTVAARAFMTRRSHAKVFNARDCCALVSAPRLFSTQDINARYSQIKTRRITIYTHSCPVWLTGYNNCTPFIAHASAVHFNIFFQLYPPNFVHTGGKCMPPGRYWCVCVCAEKLIPLIDDITCFGKKSERKFAVFGGGGALSLPFSLSQHGSLNIALSRLARSLARYLLPALWVVCPGDWWPPGSTTYCISKLLGRGQKKKQHPRGWPFMARMQKISVKQIHNISILYVSQVQNVFKVFKKLVL